MDDNGYQENDEDQHTLTRPGMVTSPHDASAMPLTLTEELQMRVQQQTGGDHTPSMLRENSDNGVVQRCSKPRPQQDKKSEQKNSGVDNELAQKLKKRRTIHEESEVQDKADTVIAHKVMAADSVTTLQQTAISSTVCRPHIPVKPRRRNNSDQTPVQELQDAGQGLEKLSLAIADTEHLLNEGPVTIQAGSEQNQDEHTRMKGELKLQQEEKCRLELNYKRQIGGLQDEHTRVVEEMKAQHQEELRHLKHQVHMTQKSVPRNDRDAEIEDLRSRLEAAYEHVAKQNEAIIQMTFEHEAEENSHEIVTHLEGKVELYQFQVSHDFNEEPAARNRAASEQESEKKRHQFEMQVLEDNLKEAVESERALKQHATKELDELRRKQTGLETEFNKALAIQASQLDAAQAEKARLLTTADQTWLDHQRQLDEMRQQNDGLNYTVKQYTADIQQLLADKEANLDLKKDESQTLKITIQLLETNLQRQNEQIQQLEARDELAPYILLQLPCLGECQGAGSYGSVYRIHLNGINCIAKRIHDILLGQGREKGVNIEDKQAAYKKFYTECVLLSRMRHPNIVQFMGIHYGPQRDYGRELTLVMERLYMNLEDCLEQYKNIEMWLKVSILLDISQGLLHLHSHGIVHRDLTAANILLTTSLHAKIADLGVSKIINVHPLAASKQSMIPGTLGYMPPEALAEVPKYGSALDVFSFGVLILFVLLQEYPQFYDNYVTPEGLARKESHIQKRSKWINMLPSDHLFVQLICDCLQDVPARRPTTNNLNYIMIQIAAMHPKPYQDIIEMQKRLQL